MASTDTNRLSGILHRLAARFGWRPSRPAAVASALPPTLPAGEAPLPSAVTPALPPIVNGPALRLAEQLRASGADIAVAGDGHGGLLATLGRFVGDHRDSVDPLLKAVLNKPAGSALRLDLRRHSAAEIGVICQFAQSLAQLGILTGYRYRRAPFFQLAATVEDCPDGRRFLASGWFPHYGRSAVLRRLGQPRPPYALEVRLSLSDGTAVDLDLVVLARSGLVGVQFGCEDLQGTLARLSRVAEALRALRPRLGLVLPRVDVKDLPMLAECFEVSVCDRQGLPWLLDDLGRLEDAWAADAPAAAAESDVF